MSWADPNSYERHERPRTEAHERSSLYYSKSEYERIMKDLADTDYIPSHDTIVCQGYLSIRRSNGRLKKNMYCLLRGKVLACYAVGSKIESKLKKPKYEIKIKNAFERAPRSFTPKAHEFPLTIVEDISGDEIAVIATSRNDRDRWMKSIVETRNFSRVTDDVGNQGKSNAHDPVRARHLRIERAMQNNA